MPATAARARLGLFSGLATRRPAGSGPGAGKGRPPTWVAKGGPAWKSDCLFWCISATAAAAHAKARMAHRPCGALPLLVQIQEQGSFSSAEGPLRTLGAAGPQHQDHR
eukprot:CAMPEP_0179153946 /NCGR_PEP_ID=MMETSP0796-20121207/74892_1 /TAXON_ID=73915 /ORGANISM="Pyrodinium bahamense, Strain pbaha01" /LENGTH=107 /DNA_ID=CAMNT_0020855273 /DNA_START=98 /DNA_END=418 /DNA_ORIENTATION=+